jgi:acyl carrier protein
MSIEEKIKEFILKNLYFVEDHALGDEDSFLNEGIIDSMGSLELVAFVESQFGIKVEMSEVVVKNFDSVRQLANFVRRKLGLPADAGSPPVEPAPAAPLARAR